MIRRLPGWAFAAAGLLAGGAGIINVVALLGFEHQAVTHLTGTTSLLGEALARADGAGALRFGGLVLAFVGGCVLSGAIVRDSVLQVGRPYGLVLLTQAVSLVAAALLLEARQGAGIYLLAVCAGLQNAMVTTFSGAAIRTTHVSGMFTDLGIYLGHRLRGVAADARRLRLSLTVIGGFLAGGITGALGFTRWSNFTLLIPAASSASLALAHEALQSRRRRG